MIRRLLAVGCPILLAMALGGAITGCGGRRALPVVRADVPESGVYAGRLAGIDGAARRFRVQLFAALPDRLHAEVLSPVGPPALILDAGAGRLAVILPRERTAWVGEASADALERILGVPVTLDALVRGLLTGGEPSAGTCALRRDPGASPGLPTELAVDCPDRTLSLRLRRLRPLAGPVDSLGTGRPPPGLERRPLEELALEPLGEAER